MATNVNHELAQAAARLAKAQPEVWRLFMMQFTDYTNNQMQNLITSPVEALAVAQGRVQALSALHTLLSECTTTADRIERKTK